MSSCALPLRASASASRESASACGLAAIFWLKNCATSVPEPNAEEIPSLRKTSTSPSDSMRVRVVGCTPSRMPSGRESLSSVSTLERVMRKASGEPAFTMSALPVSRLTVATSRQANPSPLRKDRSLLTVSRTVSPAMPARKRLSTRLSAASERERASPPLPMPSARAQRKLRSSMRSTEVVSPQAVSPSLVAEATPNAASYTGVGRRT